MGLYCRPDQALVLQRNRIAMGRGGQVFNDAGLIYATIFLFQIWLLVNLSGHRDSAATWQAPPVGH